MMSDIYMPRTQAALMATPLLVLTEMVEGTCRIVERVNAYEAIMARVGEWKDQSEEVQDSIATAVAVAESNPAITGYTFSEHTMSLGEIVDAIASRRLRIVPQKDMREHVATMLGVAA